MLQVTLTYVLSGGGAGLAAYWILANWPWVQSLSPEVKRYVAFALTALLAIAVYLACLVMVYQPTPVDWRAWLEKLFEVAAIANGVGQVVHARVVLSKPS